MNAMTKQILNDIKYKAKITPMMVESVDRVFILDHVSKYSVSGYVCGIIGDYRSNFKQVNIQKTKNGKRFIMADRVRFDADKIKPCTIAREIVEKELALSISMRETILDIQQQGNDIGYSLENQDYYIRNLKNYLNQNPA